MRYFKSFVLAFALIFLIFPRAILAQDSNTTSQEITQKLKTDCFDSYQQKFNDVQKDLETSALSEVSLTGSGSTQESSPFLVERAKESFKMLAQVNVDLYACYENGLVSEPTLLEKAHQLLVKAQKQLADIESFDFNKLFSTGKAAQELVTVPSQTTKVFRLRTFCLDSDRLGPKAGTEFYLAGAISGLKNGSTLCELLKEAKSGTGLTQVQNQIWKENNKESEKTETQSAAKTTPSLTKTILGLGAAVGGLVVFLIVLIWGLARFWIIKNSKALKVIWPLGLIILLGATGYGIWQLNKLGYFSKIPSEKTASTKTTYSETSLADSRHKGEIVIRLFSAGTLTDLDLVITNKTAKNIELDTSCLLFVPATLQNPLESKNPFWKTSTAFAASEVDMIPLQQLGSVGSIDEGPPYPEEPASPEAVAEDMKKATDIQLQLTLEEFKQNPNEQTLKEVLIDLANCQATGCAREESASKEVVDTWQKVIDERTRAYQQNPSQENKNSLISATQIGQAVGCNTTAAENALGLNR